MSDEAQNYALEPSVLSSSSDRHLAELILEVATVSRVTLFDLLILRDVDIRSMPDLVPIMPANEKFDNRTVTDIMCVRDNVTTIFKWITDQVLEPCQDELEKASVSKPKIAALATFFPGITDREQEIRDTLQCDSDPHSHAQRAVDSVANTVRLAVDLTQAGWMDHAIVEIVCGTLLDYIDASAIAKKQALPSHYANDEIFVFESRLPAKTKCLLDRLLQISEQLSDITNEWIVALELEPGPTYVVNTADAIDAVITELDSPEYKDLRGHVGINVDVAHMKIARVPPAYLKERANWLVHAHICDHPDMHTRDQIVGIWDPVERFESQFYPYLKVLDEIRSSKSDEREGRPFSNAVALELEGCNRIGWIHNSLHAMRHAFNAVRNHPGRIQIADSV